MSKHHICITLRKGELTVVVEQLLDEIDVSQNHSSAAVSLQSKLVQSIS